MIPVAVALFGAAFGLVNLNPVCSSVTGALKTGGQLDEAFFFQTQQQVSCSTLFGSAIGLDSFPCLA